MKDTFSSDTASIDSTGSEGSDDDDDDDVDESVSKTTEMIHFQDLLINLCVDVNSEHFFSEVRDLMYGLHSMSPGI